MHEAETYLNKKYSTLVVKYSWCFLLLGLVICIALGLSAVLARDLPNFNDPTKGFVPRGKNTLTSRLFVLERVKNELDKQIASAKITNKTKTSSTPSSNNNNNDDDDDDDDLDYEDNINESILLEDYKTNLNSCAFLSNNDDKCLTNEQVYKLLNNKSDLIKFSKIIEHQINKPNEQMCTSIDLNRHYEVYFESSNKSSQNLLTIDNLLSLCKKQNELMKLFQLDSTCHYTLPQMVAYFSNKTDCSQLNENDITYFISRIQRCHQLYDTGLIRLAGLKRYRQKPIELFEYDSCFRYNFTFLTLEYLLDKTFLSTNRTYFTAMWFLKPKKSKKSLNGDETHTANSAYDLFIRHFYQNQKFDDGSTKISGLNFLDIRISTAMKQIRADMFFVILAISLIVGVTIIYLRSITVALMTNICVMFSFACAYFTYKIALGIDLFPYINLMATFILIGISCDNVFVIFDAWYSEKLDIYNEARLQNRTVEFYGKLTRQQEQQYRRDCDYTMSVIQKKLLNKNSNQQNNNHNANEIDDDDNEEDEYFDRIKNPDLIRMMKVNDEQMIQMMGGLLRHAAASVFVTSFTTSAAFFTNMITRIAYVQLFGLFMGFCILFNFLMSITMIVSFVIVYEKVCEPLSARFGLFNHFPSIFDKTLSTLTRLSHVIFTVYIPRVIIKFRYILIVIFFICGIIGLIIVFYHPKLSPPKSRRYQFFQLTHPFERFEYQMRDQFLSYINEDKDNVTNPMLIFIFGIEDTDLVHPFYPEDSKINQNKQNLIYNQNIDFYDPKVLRWFDTFLKDLNRSDLFINVQQTYSQWLTIGQLLRGFTTSDKKSLISSNDKEFFVPSTRNQTIDAMERLFRLFKGSNQFQSANANDNIRIGFLPDKITKQIRAFLFTVNMNVTFNSYSVQNAYYNKLQTYFEKCLEKIKLEGGSNEHVYKQVKHGWFVSPQFLFYDLMREVIRGTYTSLIFSMLFALVVLLLTSGNVLITIYAMTTITFIIADTVAVFVLCGWELNILETIIIIMSVGLSVDFTVHYGVAYIKADWKKNQAHIKISLNQLNSHDNNNKKLNEQKSLENENMFQIIEKKQQYGNLQRFRRIKNSLIRVGSAVFVAGFTSFLAGLSMAPSKLTSFSQMGFFLMLIMFISWLFATWFFLPLLSFIGPIDQFGDIPFGKLCRCGKSSASPIVEAGSLNDNEENINVERKLNDEQSQLATIPATGFYTSEHRHLADNYIRFCFAKKDETLDKVIEILRKLKKN
ncbi:unnamed protein product [Adineta steineri]|uniref:SSD domain-containing protein n=1 Tax=Adineta steineri TaxID=433720 RepID=A0A813YD17_9BILA|nr:unnamed protein product [Adineta steineri]